MQKHLVSLRLQGYSLRLSMGSPPRLAVFGEAGYPAPRAISTRDNQRPSGAEWTSMQKRLSLEEPCTRDSLKSRYRICEVLNWVIVGQQPSRKVPKRHFVG